MLVPFVVDHDTYPTEESLVAVRGLDFAKRHHPFEGGRFLVNDLPVIGKMLHPYANVRVADVFRHGEQVKEVSFTTGGWSGCEDLIEAILGNFFLNSMYYAKWERGGLHVFVVPVTHLTPDITPATNAEDSGSTPKDDGATHA